MLLVEKQWRWAFLPDRTSYLAYVFHLHLWCMSVLRHVQCIKSMPLQVKCNDTVFTFICSKRWQSYDPPSHHHPPMTPTQIQRFKSSEYEYEVKYLYLRLVNIYNVLAFILTRKGLFLQEKCWYKSGFLFSAYLLAAFLKIFSHSGPLYSFTHAMFIFKVMLVRDTLHSTYHGLYCQGRHTERIR